MGGKGNTSVLTVLQVLLHEFPAYKWINMFVDKGRERAGDCDLWAMKRLSHRDV
jgi:hypothetical protein